jgi:hypothetical protein
LLSETWRDGSAVHYSLSANLLQRFPPAIPPFFEPMLTIGTYLTIVWEIGFCLMVLRPWTRRVALVFGIALHLLMTVGLELQTFSLVMLASYIAFLDPKGVSRYLQALIRRPGAVSEPL